MTESYEIERLNEIAYSENAGGFPTFLYIAEFLKIKHPNGRIMVRHSEYGHIDC